MSPRLLFCRLSTALLSITSLFAQTGSASPQDRNHLFRMMTTFLDEKLKT